MRSLASLLNSSSRVSPLVAALLVSFPLLPACGGDDRGAGAESSAAEGSTSDGGSTSSSTGEGGPSTSSNSSTTEEGSSTSAGGSSSSGGAVDSSSGSSSSGGPMFDEPMLEVTFTEQLCLDPRTGEYEDTTDCPPGTLLEVTMGDPWAGFNTPFFAPDLCITVDNDHYSLDDLADLVDCGEEPSGVILGDRDLAGHGLYLATSSSGRYKFLIHDNTCEDCDFEGHIALSWAEI